MREIYGQKEFNNGLRLVWEHMPNLRSIAVGVWIGTGSRNEGSAIVEYGGTSLLNGEYVAPNGISHFTEHMLFKGTEKRTAKELAECIENIGGQINAFTGKEVTCYFTKTLDTSLETALDVLSDMVLNSRFAKEDIDLERQVVLEEISMDQDAPEELVHELLAQGTYSDSSLGLPILGTAKSLQNIDTQTFKEYTKRYYTPDNTCISVAGNFDQQQLEQLVERYFGNWERGTGSHTDYEAAAFNPGLYVKNKDIEQLHMCLSLICPPPEAEQESLAMGIISTYLGGGMSSRLFQELREKRGLVYSTYTYMSNHKGSGAMTIYGAMNPDKAGEFVSVVKQELQVLADQGLSEDDMQILRQQIKGTMVLSSESSGSRMNSMGKSLILYGEIKSLDQVIALVDGLSTEMVNQVLKQYLSNPQFAVSAVGNITKEQLERIL